jgi:putative transposase
LFLDGVYESLRLRAGLKEEVLVAWGIYLNGQKVLLHLGPGSKESYAAWRDFLRDMVQRGLNVPVEITTDRAPGLIRPVEEKCGPRACVSVAWRTKRVTSWTYCRITLEPK